jgi:hypothetical protein
VCQLGGLLFRLLLHLVLALQDRAPLLVVSHRHPTFDAHLNALLWRFAFSQQFAQERHETSVFLDTFDGGDWFMVGPQKAQKAQKSDFFCTTLPVEGSSKTPE